MNADELDMEFQTGYDAYIAGSPISTTPNSSYMWRFGWRTARMDEELGLLCLTTLSILA